MSFLIRKKSTSNNHNDDGHYYISISDLMTSLLFIFILILAYMMLSFVEKQEQLNDEIKKLEQNIEARKDLLQLLKDELIKEDINVDIDKENGNMRLKSDLLFQSGSADISQEGKRQIGKIAKMLVSKLQEEKYITAIDTVFIEGHTDNKPINGAYKNGRSWTNKELSSQRAINTFSEMNFETNNEILSLKNIKNKSLLSYSGYAETRPLCFEDNDECRNKNRRIEFYFTVNTPEIKKINE
ncbi:OmpA family protein [Aliarcobacter butzleri]|uniref:OmpA/MotB family protein n=1 Tax=Aliarcobacter butzleri TaxID=28197 RepID=UPI0021B29E53|nr:OmpA family protein [Aliarcobacter butzleri]MCT7634482.1 OmpA family protein [Aliarcobacter butzleri]